MSVDVGPSGLRIGEIAVELVRKDVRRINLRVCPPDGQVRLSAPRQVSGEVIQRFVLGRLEWIRREQRRMRARAALSRRDCLDGEIHPVWGEACRLAVIERTSASPVEWRSGQLLLSVRPGASRAQRTLALESWYRKQVHAAANGLVGKWQDALGVRVQDISVRSMKTRWGSCSIRRRTIRLNTELGRRPRECLEYLLVHEMMHLLEPSHGARFVALMDRFLPQWRERRRLLNAPPGHLAAMA